MVDTHCIPHQKINQCLTNINQCLTDINQYVTDTENQFYKISVILVKYWLSISLYQLSLTKKLIDV